MWWAFREQEYFFDAIIGVENVYISAMYPLLSSGEMQKNHLQFIAICD